MIPVPAKQFTTEISDDTIADLLAQIDQIEAKAKTESKPDFLSRFRLSACVDTILIRVELANSAKCANGIKPVIADALSIDVESVYAEGATETDKAAIRAGSGSSSWLVQVEDPNKAKLQTLCDALRSAYGLASDPELEWLDLAVDFKLKGIDARRCDVKRNVISEYEQLMRWLRDAFIPDRNQGLLWEQWRYRGELGDCPDSGFPNGKTAYLGDMPNTPNARFVRLYWKDFRRVSRSEKNAVALKDRVRPLDQKDWRARFERRFSRSDLLAVGLNRISQLDGFGFHAFRRWFRFADCSSVFVPVADCMGTIRSLSLKVDEDQRLKPAVRQALYRLKL